MAASVEDTEETPEEVRPVERSEAPNNTARPNDLPIVEQEPALPNSTLASRAKAKKVSSSAEKQIESADNKAVTSAQTKAKPKA